MLFTADVTIIAGTTKAIPKEQILKIDKGIITWVYVNFPAGCHGLIECVVLHHEHQIFPSTEGMSLRGSGIMIAWNEYYESYQPPYELKIKAWSPNASYNHTITIGIAVLPRKAIIALAVVDAIKSLFSLQTLKRVFTAK